MWKPGVCVDAWASLSKSSPCKVCVCVLPLRAVCVTLACVRVWVCADESVGWGRLKKLICDVFMLIQSWGFGDSLQIWQTWTAYQPTYLPIYLSIYLIYAFIVWHVYVINCSTTYSFAHLVIAARLYSCCMPHKKGCNGGSVLVIAPNSTFETSADICLWPKNCKNNIFKVYFDKDNPQTMLSTVFIGTILLVESSSSGNSSHFFNQLQL